MQTKIYSGNPTPLAWVCLGYKRMRQGLFDREQPKSVCTKLQ